MSAPKPRSRIAIVSPAPPPATRPSTSAPLRHTPWLRGDGVAERRRWRPGRPATPGMPRQRVGARRVGHHLQAAAVAPLHLQPAALQARGDPARPGPGGRRPSARPAGRGGRRAGARPASAAAARPRAGDAEGAPAQRRSPQGQRARRRRCRPCPRPSPPAGWRRARRAGRRTPTTGRRTSRRLRPFERDPHLADRTGVARRAPARPGSRPALTRTRDGGRGGVGARPCPAPKTGSEPGAPRSRAPAHEQRAQGRPRSAGRPAARRAWRSSTRHARDVGGRGRGAGRAGPLRVGGDVGRAHQVGLALAGAARWTSRARWWCRST